MTGRGRPEGKVLLLLALVLAIFTGCRDPDPVRERIAARAAHEASVVSFSPRDDGTFLVELEVRSSIGPTLPSLTVSIRQHDAGNEILRSQRVTLDIGGMDATGVLRVYTTVDAVDGAEVFSSLVEHDLDESTLMSLPEIRVTDS